MRKCLILPWVGCALVITCLLTGAREKSADSSPMPKKPAEAAASGKIAVGKPAPDWQMNDLEGKPSKLSDYRGKKGVLLAFFATWCPFCMEEVPSLIAFQEKYKGRAVELVGAAVDQPAQVIKRFAESRGVNYKLLLDARGTVATAYGVEGIPTLVGVDAKGVIRYLDHALPGNPDALVRQLEVGAAAETSK